MGARVKRQESFQRARAEGGGGRDIFFPDIFAQFAIKPREDRRREKELEPDLPL